MCGVISKQTDAMAEAHDFNDWKSSVLCRYYMHGACRAGDSCHFSHNLADKPQSVCRYYLNNSCVYGEKCRYDHVRPNTVSSKSETSRTGKNNATTQLHHSSQAPNKNTLYCKQSSENHVKEFHMQKLRKPGSIQNSVLPSGKTAEEWVQAAEFVPGQKWKGVGGAGPVSYVEAASTGLSTIEQVSYSTEYEPESFSSIKESEKSQLCPYAIAMGLCQFGDKCSYIHGDLCDLCCKPVLHPTDKNQREQHQKECEKHLEEDMELAFAVQRSKDKSCGICMDIVWEKNPPSERRFGILSKCKHVFCLSCIRKWRAAKQFEHKIVRACPQCRVKSDFITPSSYWVEDDDEKEKLIEGYKNALSQKHCKYFDRGRGECPFNENCFYLHAHPDGRKASPKPIRRRRRENADGDIDIIGQIILWDFLEERDLRNLTAELGDLDLEEIFQLNFADSTDESDDEFDPIPYSV